MKTPAAPCAECTLDVPRSPGKLPLLVVLHGDRERASTAATRWRGNADLAMFSGVVLHGGGIPPRTDACPKRALPAYFLVGEKNPLHRLVIELRAHFETCKQPVQWDPIRNGDHEAEHRALTTAKAITILDWLAARPLSSGSARP